MEGKKNNGVVYILCGIIVILVVALGVVLWQNNKDNTKNDEKTSEKQEQKQEGEKFEDLKKDDALVKEAFSFIPNDFCGGVHIELTNTNKKITDFSNIDKFNMVLSIYADKIIATAANESVFSLDEKDLYKYFADLSFMDDFKPCADTSYDAITGKPSKDGYVSVKDSIIPFFVSYKDGKYNFTSYGTGCTGASSPGYYLKIESAQKSDKTLKINVISQYIVYDFDEAKDNFVEKTYVHKGDKTVTDANDKDKFDHYELVYDIADGNLRLTEMNIVK